MFDQVCRANLPILFFVGRGGGQDGRASLPKPTCTTCATWGASGGGGQSWSSCPSCLAPLDHLHRLGTNLGTISKISKILVTNSGPQFPVIPIIPIILRMKNINIHISILITVLLLATLGFRLVSRFMGFGV